MWIGPPEEGTGWRLVEFRPVSEGVLWLNLKYSFRQGRISSELAEFSDPPPAPENASNGSDKASAIDLTALPEPVVPSSNPPKTLIDWAVLVLNTPHPQLKVERTRHAVSLFRSGKLTSIGNEKGKGKNAPQPPDVPPREERMKIVEPWNANKKKGKGAMLHALANIEQWA